MTELPNFDSVKEALNLFSALGEAAEIHGLLCALFATGAKLRKQAWLNSLVSRGFSRKDELEASAADVLLRLFTATEEAFAAEGLSVALLLPTDDTPIEERIEALSHFAQGFLSGLNLADVAVENNENAELQEALDDMVNISCLEYEQESGEEAEQALTELVEYAKVAVMHVHQELVYAKAGSQVNNQTKH